MRKLEKWRFDVPVTIVSIVEEDDLFRVRGTVRSTMNAVHEPPRRKFNSVDEALAELGNSLTGPVVVTVSYQNGSFEVSQYDFGSSRDS